jgi:hypothetical protein
MGLDHENAENQDVTTDEKTRHTPVMQEYKRVDL